MKILTFLLHKDAIHEFVDHATYKLVDATLDKMSERSQNAVASDSSEGSDGFLITEYCDRRDSTLRKRLKFCLVDNDTTLVFDNTPEAEEPDYVYRCKVEDDFTGNDARSLCKKMDTYIKRGAIFDWYMNMGLQPTDTEAALVELEDEIGAILRGRPWGHRPMQPFGPAFWNFNKKSV